LGLVFSGFAWRFFALVFGLFFLSFWGLFLLNSSLFLPTAKGAFSVSFSILKACF